MASAKYLQMLTGVNAVVPVADTFATAAESDVIRADNCEAILFHVLTGAAADNTNTVTVEACDDVTPSNSTAIPFMYRKVTTAGTHSAVASATTSGVSFTASTANQYIEIEVDPADVEAASSHAGRRYVRCVVTEAGNAGAQVGCVYAQRVEHFAGDQPQSAIV